ncbi:MAG: type II toxin-antitoxin system RelE/ParE family toxin [Rhodospirillales bacterium]
MSGYRLRPRAVEDLQTIGDFIAADHPARAVSFIDEMLAVCRRIAERPRACQRRADLAPGLRQAVHGHYLILFTDGGDAVVIERVLLGARRLEDLL